MSTCGGNTNLVGGGRRRRGTRKMRGGNFYGAAVDPQIGSAGLAYPAVENNAVDPVSGAVKPDYAMPGGRRRRRTGKKATRKGKKSRRVTRRRRTMRGGASYAGSANVGYGYGGSGYGGMANQVGYGANQPAPGSGHSQVAGVWSA